jgi:hypothetical protein
MGQGHTGGQYQTGMTGSRRLGNFLALLQALNDSGRSWHPKVWPTLPIVRPLTANTFHGRRGGYGHYRPRTDLSDRSILPARTAGSRGQHSRRLWEIGDIVDLLEAWEAQREKREAARTLRTTL